MFFVFLTTFILSQGRYTLSQAAQEASLLSNGSLKVGEPCTRDYQCIEHAFCRVQLTCLCDPPYSPGPDKSTCHATSGTNCNVHEDCLTMSNAECMQGVCVCRDTFTLDITNSSNCIPRPKNIGDRCQRSDECVDIFERAHCINEKCKCYGDHRFVNQTGTCVQAHGIYQPCKHDYECYDEKKPDGLHCRDGECAYRDTGAGGGLSGPSLELSVGLLVLGLTVDVF